MIAPESPQELPLTPQERLERIHDFLFETHWLRVKRVGYAEILAPLVDATILASTREKILDDTNTSIKEANEALEDLRRVTNQQLVVFNPATGERAQLENLAFTPDKVTYLGRVSTRGNGNAVWDIGGIPHISLQ